MIYTAKFIVTTDVGMVDVRVCGDVSELGCWDPEQALPLSFGGSDGGARSSYYGSVSLPGTASYKILGRTSSDSPWIWWPNGENHKVAGALGADLTVKEDWLLELEPGLSVLSSDSYLRDFASVLRTRQSNFVNALTDIDAMGGMDSFSRGYEHYGFTRGLQKGHTGIFYREWAPGALGASLVGDFNGWDHQVTQLSRDSFGVWSTFLPDSPSGVEAIPHNSYVRLSLLIEKAGGERERVNRLPAYIRYTTRDEKLNEYVGRYWNPPQGEKHVWNHPRPRCSAAEDYSGVLNFPPMQLAPSSLRGTASRQQIPPTHDPTASGLRIYESHVGMSGEEGRVATYREFAANVLPRAKALGYNCGSWHHHSVVFYLWI